ncbi:MAG TPA: glycerophosphodiester phosphodiesterase [Anaeromyxobacteraceae bacterium]|nr:glycerophosphodiester phosphodiesterase [Anaeromyxobacteraceae bacterium]
MPAATRPGLPRAEGRPLVLGHRGASADAPENTLAAFRLALDQGADGVELDVWRCASGEVVVFHDEDARRLVGSPLRVTRASFSELRALDVGAWKGEGFRGERIPRLEEALEVLGTAVANVELKSVRPPGDPRLALAVARILRHGRAAERALVSSFDWTLLAAFRLAAPEVATGLLFEARSVWRRLAGPAAALLRPRALHPERTLVTPERARRWAAAGWPLVVWTVDDPEEAARLCALGAAALVTNHPGRMRETVRRATGR